MMLAAIVFAVLSALSNAGSAVLQRLAAVDRTSEASSLWRTAIDLVRQPLWLLGAVFLIGTFGFQALALYFGPLSVVQPVLYALVPPFSALAELMQGRAAGNPDRRWVDALRRAVDVREPGGE